MIKRTIKSLRMTSRGLGVVLVSMVLRAAVETIKGSIGFIKGFLSLLKVILRLLKVF